MPKDGFIKVPETGTVNITPGEKVILVRKANEMMNQKNYLGAKRIYLAIGYSAGLIRIGEYYESSGSSLEALKMYKAAKAQTKLDNLTKRMADVLRLWLK